jgi:hypothetical protein
MVLLVTAAHAFTVKSTDDGDTLRWRRFPIGYTWYGAAPDGVSDPERELAAAFGRWADVPGVPVRFAPEPGRVDVPVESPDDLQLVWAATDWPFDPELLAMTSSWSRDDTGEIVAFDLRINAGQPWSDDDAPDAFDFRACLTHEAGHVLGLDHSALESATMFATTGPGEAWRAQLSPDDEAGARFLYPRAAGVARVSCSVAPEVAAGSLALFLVSGTTRRRTGGSPCSRS